MKLFITCLLTCFISSLCAQPQKTKILKDFRFNYDHMEDECSTFLIAYVKMDEKGRIDTVSFMSQSSSVFALDITNGFKKLKEAGKIISQKNLVVFFSYLNLSKQCKGEVSGELEKYLSAPSVKFKEDDCIFIGPIVGVSIQ